MKYNEITDAKIIEVIDAFRTYLGSYDDECKKLYKDSDEWVGSEYWNCLVRSDSKVECHWETLRIVVLEIFDGDDGGPHILIANFSEDVFYKDLKECPEWGLEQITHLFDTQFVEFVRRDHLSDNSKIEVYNISAEKFE